MRLRTFHAATMKEAMARVRAEMGPDAVIIYCHERKRGRGVEVRAAAEPSPPQAKPARIQGGARTLAGAAGALKPPVKPSSLNGKGVSMPKQSARRRAELCEILCEALAFHGLAAKRAAALSALAGRLEEADAALALAKALEAKLTFQPVAVLPARPIMLVGGPGVGKTVTTAKLAARARLAGEAVRVVSTDTLRSGAIEQLAKLLNALGLKAHVAASPEKLSEWLGAHRSEKAPMALFIDTPGTNALALSEREDLLRFIKAGDIEPVLVQAAGADCSEAAADAELFAALGARRLIVTRLDAARRLGGLVAAADATGLAVAQVSLSPYLSEPLSELSAAALARILLTQSGGAMAVRRSGPTPAKEQPVP